MALDDHAQVSSLPCGTLLDDLIAQITEGAAPADRVHQGACRYCQTALDAIRDAWEEFQTLARSAVAIPEGLADRIVARVRLLARTGGDGVVIDAVQGQTQIASGVLARIAREAALTVPDVALATVLGAEPDPEHPGGALVSIRLVAVLGRSMEAIAGAVRDRVIDALSGQTGVVASRVDVAVEDVVLDGEIP